MLYLYFIDDWDIFDEVNCNVELEILFYEGIVVIFIISFWIIFNYIKKILVMWWIDKWYFIGIWYELYWRKIVRLFFLIIMVRGGIVFYGYVFLMFDICRLDCVILYYFILSYLCLL